MRKFFYSLCIITYLLLGLSSVTVAAENNAPTDAKAYYLYILQKYKDAPITADIKADITTPLANCTLSGTINGITAETTVFKAVYNLTLSTPGKNPVTEESISYYEQIKDKYTVYTQDKNKNNGKWRKKTTKLDNDTNVYLANQISPEQTMEFVKTAEFTINTPEVQKIKVVFDFEKLFKKVETLLLDSSHLFKNPQEKEEVTAFYKQLSQIALKSDDLAIYYTIDNTKNSCVVEADLTKTIRESAIFFINHPKSNLKPEDRQLLERLVADSSVVIVTNIQMLNKPEIITVPKEVKRSAKEVKSPKKAKSTKKASVNND